MVMYGIGDKVLYGSEGVMTVVDKRAVTVGGVSTFSISKMTADPAFEEKLYRLLTDDGIAVEVEGSDFYER